MLRFNENRDMSDRWAWHDRIIRRGVRIELIPKGAIAAADRAELGAYERMFGKRGRLSKPGFNDLLAAICVGIGLFADWNSWSTILWCLGVALVVVSFGWRMIAGDDNAHLRVYLFEGGMVCRDQSANIITFRWTDIQVYENVTRSHHLGDQATRTNYTIVRSDGYRLALVHAEFQSGEVSVLGEAIQGAVTTVQLPDVKGLLTAGERVTFGDLTIDEYGIAKAEQTLPWSEISAVRTHDGFLEIHRTGQQSDWYVVAMSDFPNVEMFRTLADALGHGVNSRN